MDSIVECRNLTKCFPGCIALNSVNLSIPKGQIVGLLGPNGSGKSTLIKLMNGLLTPTAGEVRINGMKPGAETKKLCRIFRSAHT